MIFDVTPSSTICCTAMVYVQEREECDTYDRQKICPWRWCCPWLCVRGADTESISAGCVNKPMFRRTLTDPEKESFSFFLTTMIPRESLKPMLLSPLDSVQNTKGALR